MVLLVSWENPNDGMEEPIGSDVVDPGSSSSATANTAVTTAAGPSDDGGELLFDYARKEAWEELIERLEITPPEVIRERTNPASKDEEERGDSILHVVAVMEQVPIRVVQTILERTSSCSKCLAAKPNHQMQTALHLAVISMPERTDVIECLYRSCPDCTHARDSLRSRPIDILTETIIRMEEVIKYSRRNNNEEERCRKQMLNSLWQTVRVLVGATTTGVQPQILVHACLRSKQVPFSLTERAIKHNKDQLAAPDANGDMPLHIVARIPPPAKRTGLDAAAAGRDVEEYDDDDGDLLERIIELYPNAAFHFNNEHQIPLAIAIQSGRKWNSGILPLLQVNPVGMEELQIPFQIFPFFLEMICHHPTTIYQVLQSQPGLFLYSRGGDNDNIK